MTAAVDRDRRDFLAQVTPVILTFNEAPNIGRVLDRLTPFQEVLVVDSGSDDGTLEIVARYPNTRTVVRPFDSFSGQWNFAIREGGIRTEWALAMDADYVLPDDFLEELSRLSPAADVGGYRISFVYFVFGKALSTTLYPPVIALLRHRQAHYVQDGHCMRALVEGTVGALRSRILHDDRKPLARWLSSQARYAEEEAILLLDGDSRSLRVQDRIRRMIVVAPWLVPLHYLVVRGGILDGWRGIYYAIQRGVAESILALRLLERRVTGERR
jgi:glycosyltransferase involved in cell wall biosynthesis